MGADHAVDDEEVEVEIRHRRWLSQSQLARELGVSRWTIARARDAGRIRVIEVQPGFLRYDRLSVEELVEG